MSPKQKITFQKLKQERGLVITVLRMIDKTAGEKMTLNLKKGFREYGFLCLGRAKSILHKNTSCIICILIEFHARTHRTPISNYYF